MLARLRRPAIAIAAVLALLPALASCADGDAALTPAAAAVPAPDLRHAPWADQPDGSPSIHEVAALPSLGFPAGVTYPQALTRLLTALAESGGPPAEAIVLDPLPVEVVYVTPAGPGDGLRLSLTAPWGWIPGSGAIRPPSYSLPGSLTPEQAQAAAMAAVESGDLLPPGAIVDVPALPACEIAHGDPSGRVPCG